MINGSHRQLIHREALDGKCSVTDDSQIGILWNSKCSMIMSQTIPGEAWDGKCWVTDDSQTSIKDWNSKLSIKATDTSQRGMRWQMLSHRWITHRYHSRKQQMFHDSHRQFTDRYEIVGHLHKIHRWVWNSKRLVTVTDDSQTGMVFSITWQMFSMSHARVMFSVMCSWAWCSLSSDKSSVTYDSQKGTH